MSAALCLEVSDPFSRSRPSRDWDRGRLLFTGMTDSGIATITDVTLIASCFAASFSHDWAFRRKFAQLSCHI